MTAVYIHFPFCVQRCQYCDFITYAQVGHFIPAYLEALKKEIQLILPGKTKASSIYFGGGTPSLLNPAQVDSLVEEIRKAVGINDEAEITLEANPGTVSPESLRALRKVGVNRLSLGIQSFSDEELRILGRIHSADQAWQSISQAQQAGFENLSLDFIFGLPGQSLLAWKENLEKAVSSGIQHLSLYSLIVEPNTSFETDIKSGKLQLPEDDLVADMFEVAMDYLPIQGFNQYEISSWALGNENESRHNKVYWQNHEYFGFGAGAHGKIGDYRVENTPGIATYISKLADAQTSSDFSPANVEKVFIDQYAAMQESMLLGLRMTREGVSERKFRAQHQADMNEVFMDEIGKLQKSNLVEWHGQPGDRCLVLTRRGIMLGNLVFQEFV
mgnify:CR=1 FL=1